MDDWRWLSSVLVAFCVVGVSTIAFYTWRRRKQSGNRKKRKDFPEKEHPENDVFTMERLKEWDGVDAKMYIGVCGKVIDVSPSENFVPEQGYGKLWGGRDATYALAKMSLDPEVANKLDFTIEDLEPLERKSLKSWKTHFSSKYQEVGTIKEYEGFDFSLLEHLPSDDENEDMETNCPTDDVPADTSSDSGAPKLRSAVDAEMEELQNTVNSIRNNEQSMSDVE